MLIKAESQHEYDEWNHLVLNSSTGTIFNTSHWIKSVCGNCELLYFKKGDKILGGFIYSKIKKAGISGLFIPPYTPIYAPLWFDDIYGTKSIYDYRQFVEELMREIGSPIQDLLVSQENLDLLVFKWLGFIARPITTFRIRKNEFDLESIHKSKQRYVKRLINLLDEGKIQFVEDANPLKVIELQQNVAQKKGFNSNEHVLQEVVGNSDLLKNMWCMALCDLEGKYLAGCLAPYDNNSVYHLVNASNFHPDKLLNKANILLTFLLAKRAVDSGKIMDFEGSMLEGVEEFYRHFAATAEFRFRVTKYNVKPLNKILNKLL